MIKLLIAFKKNIPFVWLLVEYFNGIIFRFLYHKRIIQTAKQVLENYKGEQFRYRFLKKADLPFLFELFQNQDQEQFKYFKPHAFDEKTLYRLYKNPSFLMLGVFDKDNLAGYFFLRCFINRKCFLGRLVDVNYQGLGFGKRMGEILYNIAWESNF